MHSVQEHMFEEVLIVKQFSIKHSTHDILLELYPELHVAHEHRLFNVEIKSQLLITHFSHVLLCKI
jgi:hypothetical protein